MIHRELQQAPEYVFPREPWRFVEARYSPAYVTPTETLMSVSNGYLGIRATPDEGGPSHEPATLINGFYESWPIVYPEEAHGFARIGQTIVNQLDATQIRLFVDDEPFYLATAELVSYERALDMQAGTLDRSVLWETPAGKRVAIRSRRLVSFEHRHVAAILYEVELQNAAAPVVLESTVRLLAPPVRERVDPRVRKTDGRVLLASRHGHRDKRMVLAHATRASKLTVACGVDHVLETGCSASVECRSGEDHGEVVVCADARPGDVVRLVKYVVYHDSSRASADELCARAERSLDRAVADGFDALLASQRARLDSFWKDADIEVEGNVDAQQAIRFNLFHIFQASARAEGAGLPAKGLTGTGYEGHYFWDTEIYVLPFLAYTQPRIARNLLKFRLGFLDAARQRAREVNQEGALFPWRTINGEEASAYYAAGTAQYHINADVTYALKRYTEVTGDDTLLRAEGAEALVETARLWLDLGFTSEVKGGVFCIDGVTGPDEYNTVVNNNAYTNLMARQNLRFAAETVRWLAAEHPRNHAALVHRTKLEPGEVEAWEDAAERMYVPYDERRGIHLQDDSFLSRKPWDFERVPADKYPLLLHFHPLVIYRHRVIKQADVVLAMVLLPHEFTPDEKRRNFDYYDPLTTGDSSLSVCVQAIAAAELGYRDLASQYASYGLFMDLSDVHGNVADGCHIATMGGTWMMLVQALSGLRDWGGRLCFEPHPTTGFDRVSFPLRFRGAVIEVEIRRDAVRYTLREGDELRFEHCGEEVVLTAAEPAASRALEPASAG